MGSQDTFQYAMSSNHAWAGYKAHQNPTFFQKLAAGQSPSILWIGCADSRVPETTVTGLQPGDIFVHRNIANIVSPTDINTSAVLEYGVAHLKVKHIVICGHSACGGCNAVLAEQPVGGVLDTWLTPLREVHDRNAEEISAIKDDLARNTRVSEMNVKSSVSVVMNNWIVKQAIRERGLQVHGCMFDLASGRLSNLGVGTDTGFFNTGAQVSQDLVRGKHAMLVFRNGSAEMATR
ncbi:hypothetical protein TD95_004446 [Thielaviopsis punctulata]|uniref:Carbonic anhydrase n=1 Tax=Thielaviopsis punctulata TaxID=72032 RepID=A0A0F4ZD40_9PEZI|nr:hypothetical protein TD95_004446 [Thielaviopsis punctulata]